MVFAYPGIALTPVVVAAIAFAPVIVPVIALTPVVVASVFVLPVTLPLGDDPACFFGQFPGLLVSTR